MQITDFESRHLELNYFKTSQPALSPNLRMGTGEGEVWLEPFYAVWTENQFLVISDQVISS